MLLWNEKQILKTVIYNNILPSSVKYTICFNLFKNYFSEYYICIDFYFYCVSVDLIVLFQTHKSITNVVISTSFEMFFRLRFWSITNTIIFINFVTQKRMGSSIYVETLFRIYEPKLICENETKRSYIELKIQMKSIFIYFFL